jgi:hypothetical protein
MKRGHCSDDNEVSLLDSCAEYIGKHLMLFREPELDTIPPALLLLIVQCAGSQSLHHVLTVLRDKIPWPVENHMWKLLLQRKYRLAMTIESNDYRSEYYALEVQHAAAKLRALSTVTEPDLRSFESVLAQSAKYCTTLRVQHFSQAGIEIGRLIGTAFQTSATMLEFHNLRDGCVPMVQELLRHLRNLLELRLLYHKSCEADLISLIQLICDVRRRPTDAGPVIDASDEFSFLYDDLSLRTSFAADTQTVGLETIEFHSVHFERLSATWLGRLLFAHAQSLKRFGISQCTFVSHDVMALAASLSDVPMIPHLDTLLLSNVLVAPADLVCAMFLRCPSLRHLDLSSNGISNADLDRICVEALRYQPPLHVLDLSHNSIVPRDCPNFLRFISHHVTLQTLLLSSCSLLDNHVSQIMTAASQSKSITELDCSANLARFSSAGWFELLSQNTTLKRLDMSHCSLQSDFLTAELVEALCCHPTIARVALGSNMLASSVSLFFAQPLPSGRNSSLQVLDLHGNRVEAAAARALIRGLCQHWTQYPSLTLVILLENFFTVSDVADEWSALVHETQWERVVLQVSRVMHEHVDGLEIT